MLPLVFLLACTRMPELLDGTRLARKAASGGTIELPAGNHPELILRRAVTLRGQGEPTRLAPLVVEEKGVRLESLVVRATENAPAIDVRKGASLHLRHVRVECSPAAPTGLLIAGRVEAHELTVSKGCERAVDIREGHLILRSSHIVGERVAMRVVDAALEARGVRLEVSDPENGAVLVAARSDVRLSKVSLSGGEQGLLVRGGTTTGREIRVDGTVTGIGFVQATACLERVRLQGPFSHAGVLASDAPDVRICGLDVERAGASGVLALRSTLLLSDVSVAGARVDADGDFGNAVTLQASNVDIDGLVVRDAQAAALHAGKSVVRVKSLQVRESGVAVIADNRASVVVEGLSKDERTHTAVSAEASTVRFEETPNVEEGGLTPVTETEQASGCSLD